MTEQLEMRFGTRKVQPAQLARDLIEALEGRGWVQSAVLCHRLKWSERMVRAAAEAANGDVLSGPGSPGYKLTKYATPEDMRSVATLESQAKRMLARATAIRRKWHNPHHSTP